MTAKQKKGVKMAQSQKNNHYYHHFSLGPFKKKHQNMMSFCLLICLHVCVFFLDATSKKQLKKIIIAQ